MPYNNAIPQANDRISDSQLALLNNFASIYTVMGINHVNFDDVSGNQGKHKYVTFPEQLAAPVTLPNEMAIYSRESPYSGNTQLCIRDENNGVVTEFTSGINAAQGWTRLPSNILLKWGNAVTTGTGAIDNVIFPVGANTPAFTNIFQILVSTNYVLPGADGDSFVRVNGFVAPWTDFSVWGSPRTTVGSKAVAFSYFAIGE